MKTIAIMTMIFLPGSFFAAIFAMPVLDWETEGVVHRKFWIYLALTLPSTLVIGIVWYFIAEKEASVRWTGRRGRGDKKKV
ncbi:MAG: CorA family divalent cation transporter [Desulfobacterales bacterium]|nr:CorA family divalent cation transporter [Desulfobacterales bacterium]